jgi:DNA-binding transcriptional ArsR family regulator
MSKDYLKNTIVYYITFNVKKYINNIIINIITTITGGVSVSYFLKEIFGDTARVRILEELAERWGEKLSASELARMTDISEKTVYNHLHQLEQVGIVISMSGRPTKYGLNPDDQRALSIAFIEDEEYLRRIKLSIEETSPHDDFIKNSGVKGAPYLSLFKNNKNFQTSFDMDNIKLEGESK